MSLFKKNIARAIACKSFCTTKSLLLQVKNYKMEMIHQLSYAPSLLFFVFVLMAKISHGS